jgi:site-specific DNA recombinase
LDRLTRSSKDFHKLIEQLGPNNVGIKSATETIDTTTAVGRFQFERETISERVSFVMEERNENANVVPFFR